MARRSAKTANSDHSTQKEIPFREIDSDITHVVQAVLDEIDTYADYKAAVDAESGTPEDIASQIIHLVISDMRLTVQSELKRDEDFGFMTDIADYGSLPFGVRPIVELISHMWQDGRAGHNHPYPPTFRDIVPAPTIDSLAAFITDVLFAFTPTRVTTTYEIAVYTFVKIVSCVADRVLKNPTTGHETMVTMQVVCQLNRMASGLLHSARMKNPDNEQFDMSGFSPEQAALHAVSYDQEYRTRKLLEHLNTSGVKGRSSTTSLFIFQMFKGYSRIRDNALTCGNIIREGLEPRNKVSPALSAKAGKHIIESIRVLNILSGDILPAYIQWATSSDGEDVTEFCADSTQCTYDAPCVQATQCNVMGYIFSSWVGRNIQPHLQGMDTDIFGVTVQGILAWADDTARDAMWKRMLAPCTFFAKIDQEDKCVAKADAGTPIDSTKEDDDWIHHSGYVDSDLDMPLIFRIGPNCVTTDRELEKRWPGCIAACDYATPTPYPVVIPVSARIAELLVNLNQNKKGLKKTGDLCLIASAVSQAMLAQDLFQIHYKGKAIAI